MNEKIINLNKGEKHLLAEVEGIEPSYMGLETILLPLN